MGGKTATTTQSVQIPPEVMARYRAVNTRAEQVAEQPFQQYGGQFVAPLTGTQQAGVQAIQQASGAAQPYYGAAAGLTAGAVGDVSPMALETQKYLSPYTENVVDATRRALEQQQGMQLSEQQSAAIRGGAFGGDRAAIQRAVLQGQQGLATAQAIAPLYQQGFGQALQTAQQQQGVNLAAEQANKQRQLAAGAQFGQLGTGAQGAGLAGAQALLGAGTLEQQTQQADLTARYQQFLQERGYPFQVAQFLANIAMGTGALSGSTTTTTAPQPFFSDEREKTNVQPLGKGLYAYDYIDDVRRAEATGSPMPPKRVGPMAQDVEKTRPGLVVDVDDYKVVDPGRDSMGGVVTGPGAYGRGGYAPGGLVGAEDLRSLLQAQQQFLGPYAGQGTPYGGQQQGKPGYVPQASLPVPKLMTAGPAPQQRPGGLAELASGINQTAGVGESLLGEKGLFGEKGLGSKAMAGLGKVRDIASPPPAPTVSSGSTGADSSMSKSEEESRKEGAAYGGLMPHGYAAGGMPYGGDPLLQGVIDEGKDEIRQLPKPGEPPKPPGGLGSDLKDAASIIGAGSSLYSAGSAAASALPTLMAFLPFSDARLKNNIAPVGETYDGQQIYRYDMGDGRTQLGLMAQEVAQRKPDAVGERNGFLTLDYDRATEDATPRAYGGLVPRSGYADGGPPVDGGEGTGYSTDVLPGAIRKTAQELGVNPLDLATAISYETGGTFDPWQKGPTTRWGQHRGLIQWGGPQRQQYGITEDMPAGQQMQAVGEYLRDRGVRSGMGLPEIYSAINAGTVGRLGAVDMGTTVAQKLASPQMARHRQVGAQFLGLNPGDYPAEGSQEAQLERPGAGQFVNPMAQKGQPAESGLSAPRSFEGKPQSWGDFATSKQFLIPLLSGLGAMASSPSRYLGSAVLQGLGAGAQAYSNLEAKEAATGQTRAQTFETMQRAANLSLVGEPVSGYSGVRLANGKMIPITEWIRRYRAGEDVTPLGGVEAIPALLSAASKAAGEARQVTEGPQGARTAPTTSMPMEKPQMPIGVVFGDKSMKAAETDMDATIGPNRDINKAQSAGYVSATGTSARAASEAQPLLNEMAINVSKTVAGKGFDTPGVTFAGRAQLANVGNTILRSLGVSDPKYMLSEADTRQALAEKFNAIQSLGLARGAGQESLGALQAVMASMPQTTMPPEAQAQLAAQLLMLSKKSRDREAHMNEYGRISQNSFARANEAFETDNPNNNYLSQVTMLKDLILKDPKAVEMMATGRVSAKQIEDAFRARAERLKQPYVPGLSQYFTR
jgi:hypothetical protein